MIIVTIMAMMFNLVRIIMIQILLRVLPSIDCIHHIFILDFWVIRIQLFLVFQFKTHNTSNDVARINHGLLQKGLLRSRW